MSKRLDALSAIVLSIFVIFLITSANASFLIPTPLSERIKGAELIVEGTVENSSSYWNQDNTHIYTLHEIKVFKVLKGNPRPKRITLITPGGRVGNKMERVTPSLDLSEGDVGIFMVEHSNELFNDPSLYVYDHYRPIYGQAGFIKYHLKDGKASDPFDSYNNSGNQLLGMVKVQTLQQPVEILAFDAAQHVVQTSSYKKTAQITSFSPLIASAGTRTVLTINGSGFGNTRGNASVEFENTAAGPNSYDVRPASSQYLSWSDNEIKVEIPSEAGTGAFRVTRNGVGGFSPSAIVIEFARKNIISTNTQEIVEPQYINQSGAGGYIFQMSTDFQNTDPVNDGGAPGAVRRALNKWRCNSGTPINFTIGPPTNVDVTQEDGINLLHWDPSGNEIQGGHAAIVHHYYESCGSGVNEVWYVNEVDVVFDNEIKLHFGPGSNQGTGGRDFTSVLMFFFGEAFGFGRTSGSAPHNRFDILAHHTTGFVSSFRNLSPNNIKGLNYFYNQAKTANSCGPSPMADYQGCSTTAPIANFSTSTSMICVGGEIDFTNASTGGSAGAWFWTFSGGTPSSSVLENPTDIAYTNPGTYTVTLTVRNAAGENTTTKTIEVIPPGCIPPTTYQNPANRFDVNNDGIVSPIDVLQVINYLNTVGPGLLPLPRDPNLSFLDVSGDDFVSAIDVLRVINFLANN